MARSRAELSTFQSGEIMNHIKTGNFTAAALGWLGASALLACTAAKSEYAPPEALEGQSAQAVVGNERLSATEWQAYMADHVYVNSLVKPGTRVRLNMADPRQHAFAMARLKLAGKNEKNSPYLFERIEARRKQHLAAGYKVGQLSEELRIAETNERQEGHKVTKATFGGASSVASSGPAAAVALAEGAATSTYPDGAYYTWLDVSYSTVTGYPIGPLVAQEEFEREDGFVGADLHVETSGNPNQSPVKQWAISSYKMEDSPDGFTDSYSLEVKGSANRALGGPLTLSAPLIREPVDHTGDALISLCVHRGSPVGCDSYLEPPPGEYWHLQVPMQGEIHAMSNHYFSQAKIDEILRALTQGMSHEDAGTFTVTLTTKGGGCPVAERDDVNVPIRAQMLAFWKTVALKDGDRTFTWNLTGNETGLFRRSCAINDNLKITAFIPLTLFAGDDPINPITSSMTLSNDLRELPIGEGGRIERAVITNSCLAKGTKILVKGGKARAIESLKIGQEVANPYDGSDHALTIMDAISGVEPTPMVRILDEAGRTLLLTEMHPLSTPDRGMVQARALRAGDVVMTTDGPSKLTEVTREAYSGRVYNLKIGSERELANLQPDQTIIYANGFVVGDAQIQSKHEDLADRQERTSPAAKMPSQWRQDYELSGQRD